MDNARATARSVGILFIVATALFVVGQTIYGPVLNASEYLEVMHPQRARVVAGLVIELVAVLSIPLIAVFFFPVLRHQSEALALGYVTLRVLEAVLLLLVDAGTHSLLGVSESYLTDGAAGAVHWQAVGDSIHVAGQSAFLMSVGFVFPLGAMIVNGLLFRSRLIPRPISAWGFLGAALLLVGSVLNLFDVFAAVPAGVLETTLTAPIAIQEMALAVWLIARGFDPGRLEALRSA